MAPRKASDAEMQVRRRVAANVRRLRASKKLTVIAAAESVGMHLRLWQKVEAADLNWTAQTLTRLALALDADVRDLLK